LDWESRKLKDFVKYFEKEYAISNQEWYVGASPIGIGNTNNGIEGLNQAIKMHFTNYTIQDLCTLVK
jgi:hypothetical protein